jgi:hypothetical protein
MKGLAALRMPGRVHRRGSSGARHYFLPWKCITVAVGRVQVISSLRHLGGQRTARFILSHIVKQGPEWMGHA